MSKVRATTNGGQAFWCPGCKGVHVVNSHPQGPRWAYNGDPEKPTFSPSILVTCDWVPEEDDDDDDGVSVVCHSFVTDGRIQFLGDCTHKLAGVTLDLPDWPYAPGAYGGVVDP